MPNPETIGLETCNRHSDCEAAERAWRARVSPEVLAKYGPVPADCKTDPVPWLLTPDEQEAAMLAVNHHAALREACEAIKEAAECDGKTIPDGVIACSDGKPLPTSDVRELWLMRAYLKARAVLRALDEAVGR